LLRVARRAALVAAPLVLALSMCVSTVEAARASSSPFAALPVVFDGGFETGNPRPWNTPQCANYGTPDTTTRTFGTFSVATDVYGQGSYAGRFDLPAAPKLTRCEVLRPRTIALGTDDYYSLMVYLPNNWTPGTNGFWGVEVAQLNFENIWGAPISLQAHPDHITLALQTGACNSSRTARPGCVWSSNADSPGKPNLPPLYAIPSPMQLGVWHELIVHSHWATDNTGAIEVWYRQKGQPSWTRTVNLSGYPTVQTLQDGSYPTTTVDKIGAYRDVATAPTSVWLDSFTTATSFAAAASNLP
jgi:hypothetical protein